MELILERKLNKGGTVWLVSGVRRQKPTEEDVPVMMTSPQLGLLA